MDSTVLVAGIEGPIIIVVYIFAILFWTAIGVLLVKKRVARIFGYIILAKCVLGLILMPVVVFLGVIDALGDSEPVAKKERRHPFSPAELYGDSGNRKPFGKNDILDDLRKSREESQRRVDRMWEEHDRNQKRLHDSLSELGNPGRSNGFESMPRVPSFTPPRGLPGVGGRGATNGIGMPSSPPVGFDRGGGSGVGGTRGSSEPEEVPPYDLGRLGLPQSSLPPLRIDMKRAKHSALVGFESGQPFEDLAANKAVMIGLIVGLVDDKFNPIRHVQPVYQVEGQYQLGKLHGEKEGKQEFLKARDGYAVGGFRASGLDRVTGIQLLYLRSQNGELKRNDFYFSDWAGVEKVNSTTKVSENGKYIVGIYGYQNGNSITGLGVTSFRGKRDDAAIKARKNPSQPKPGVEVRTWKSSNGEHSFEASFERLEGDQVVLKPPVGDEIKVPIGRLSEPDKDYIASVK